MADEKTTSLEGQELTDLEKLATPNGDYLLLVHDGNGAKVITLDDLKIPMSVAEANISPRKVAKTMTWDTLQGYLSEVANEDFTHVRLGDIITAGGRSYYITEFDRNKGFYGRSVKSIDLISVDNYLGYGNVMNDTNITTGGYVGSKMYTTTLPTVLTELQSVFGSYLNTIKTLLDNAVSSGATSGWAWYDRVVDLPNQAMVYGVESWNDGGYNIGNDHQQLALFKVRPQLICNGANYWLRDVTSASAFALVSGDGYAGSYSVSWTDVGVRVCFSIKLTA